MKLNCYAIIPANVRYDKKLSQGAKLLYAEFSAASLFDGTVEEDVKTLCSVLDCDQRTYFRYVSQLVKCGYIEKTSGIIRLPMGFQSLSSNQPVEQPIPDDLMQFFREYFRRFEEGLSTKVGKQELYYETMMERMKTFSQNEMWTALENRVAFVRGSEWHNKPENRPNAVDITLLIKDNSCVLKWLNMKNEKQEEKLTPFKF